MRWIKGCSYYFFIADIIAGSQLPDEGQTLQRAAVVEPEAIFISCFGGERVLLTKTDKKNGKTSVQKVEIVPFSCSFCLSLPHFDSICLEFPQCCPSSAEKDNQLSSPLLMVLAEMLTQPSPVIVIRHWTSRYWNHTLWCVLAKLNNTRVLLRK